eukprot:s3136_g10.t1
MESFKAAFEEIHSFDSAVGQQTNETKTQILSRKQKDVQGFLLKVGRSSQTKKAVKSLGFPSRASPPNTETIDSLQRHLSLMTFNRKVIRAHFFHAMLRVMQEWCNEECLGPSVLRMCLGCISTACTS